MKNQIYLNDRHPLDLLAQLSALDSLSGSLALRNNQIIPSENLIEGHEEQQVFRRIPGESESPAINIYNFNFYFGNSAPSASVPVPSSVAPRGFAGDFPEPVTLKVSPLQSLITGYHPLLRVLREEGVSLREYSRAVELVGAILAETWLGTQYLAEAAVVEWPNGITTDILGIFNSQAREAGEILDLKLGRLSFDSSRRSPAPSSSYKDPNITFHGRNGSKLELNQVPGVPTFYVENCLVRFLR